jgi:hypothetical protein
MRAKNRDRARQVTFHLDELLESRRLTLTELANRVDITLVNLSVLKTTVRKRSDSQHWKPFARFWIVSPASS